MKGEEWKWCACAYDQLYPEHDDEEFFDDKKCGCGTKHLKFYRGEIIHWRDEHWLPMCAFNKAVGELKILEKVIFGG
jgi:hypothetical protein